MTTEEMADEVALLLEERLRLKQGDLAHKLRRAGRRLPPRVRAAGEVLVRAEALLAVPKLAMQIDQAAVTRAHETCVKHLRGVNLGLARRNMWLDIAASVGFSLLAVGLLVLAVIRLRGLA